ncbi:tetraacyldisaccharide 4'-kinase [uncultured Mailhella sp.]|uniref:tetraacyldisaccharide 4'-kinase n=1 Tax=uncultured Mailhella sp. TaxID=1981031 RepID=UPI0025E40E09|nr:tetraacyldisaccharide 4'-kinase [uncultured Mailhella sp.]
MAKRHPLQDILAPLLLPLSLIYGLGGSLRRRLTRKGVLRQWKPPRPCASIGNISWGGTGKTPVTDWLLSQAAKRGLRVAVLTRGYGAHPSSLPLRARPGVSASECGDEPLMLASAHPDAVVMVDPDRNRAGRFLEEHDPPDFYLLDDGFQHLSTGRDLDIVLLDRDDVPFAPLSGRPPSNWNRVIPAGSWRERESALDEADLFLIKTVPDEWPALVPALKARLSSRPRPVFAFRMAPVGLRPLDMRTTPSDGARYRDAAAVAGPYVFVCGIGDPSQALRTVTEFFRRPPEKMLSFPDHHDFSKEKAAIEAPGLPVVCTGKDAVKLAPLSLAVPAFSLEVSAEFFASLSAEAVAGVSSSEPETDFETWWNGWLTRHLV